GFPDVIVSYPILGVTIPVWWAEGVAQFQSPSRRYDYRDSHREMILRDRVVTDNLLDYNEMSVFGKTSIGNESAYNQGFAFVRYLAKTFGDTIVSRMSQAAKSPLNLDFKGVIKKTTGKDVNEVFSDWHNYLRETYTARLKTINQHLEEGEPFVDVGFGNLRPVVSPDGKMVAYIASGNADYLSQNQLQVQILETGTIYGITGRIFSSITWSPDSRYLAYSKQTHLQPNGSSFNDLYIYDLKQEKEYRITNAMRGRNPDWSHDGKKLAFVIATDGGTNLFVLDLAELSGLKKNNRNKTAFFDLLNYSLVETIPDSLKKHWEYRYRKVKYWGNGIRQLTFFKDGRQIFSPRWSPDDSYLIFDTSVSFGRDIARIPSGGGEMSFVLNSRSDERDPQFHPATGELYYTCDETGIFNIYSIDLKTGERQAHTNVIGGAFMPSVTPHGDLFYSLYKNQGYKLYRIKNVNAMEPAYLTYIDGYEKKIPQISVDDEVDNPRPSRPYKRSFPGISVMPRLLIDYGTVKPGLYLSANEIVDKMNFLTGFDVNRRGEYNIFALFDFRLWKPTLFINAFNQTAKIEDSFNDPDSFFVSNDQINTNFNLLEIDVGLRGQKLGFLGVNVFSFLNWELSYIFSLYRAKIGTFAYKELSTGITFVNPTIRYTYLKAHALKLLLRHAAIKRELDTAINPRGGRYVTFAIQREWNRFLVDFATDRAIGIEEFADYNFWRLEMNWEEYFTVPLTRRHSLTLRFQGGYIDKNVDDFFNFFAGGLVGLKGYPYYSIEGQYKAIGTVTYRFPLFRNINRQILNVYLNKIYLGAFFQYGNAWTGATHFDEFLSDVGFQLRLETYSWYLFPTRIFFEAVTPLKENFNINTGITYTRDWKFYFGVLFDFDLRLEKRFRR
ncbi:MAG: hypothetical protein ACE5GL_02525, partial [Calditrichia bacterium]